MGEPLIALRRIQPADEAFQAGLYASTRAGELAQTGWSDAQKAAFCRMQFAAQSAHYSAHYPGGQFQIIECNGAAAGRLLVERSGPEIHIIDISLLPEFHGQGIGTRLLGELQEEARASGKGLSIHVEKFNPALRLYERLGFQPVEDKGVYLLMEWRAE